MSETAVKIGVDDIGRLIKAAREAMGLTQVALAQKAGVSRRTLWRMEKGDTGYRLTTLMVVSEALGLRLRVQIKGADDEIQK